MDQDQFVQVETMLDGRALILRVKAVKNVTLTELQGHTADLDAFGATMPSNFRKMLFGEGVEIPDGMKEDIEVMNRCQFRWGCNIPVKGGEEVLVSLPATASGKDRAVFTLAYKYPKFLGLLKGQSAIYVKYVAGA
jgi:hypothetical protein